jgi:hypothetical protein
MTRPWLSCLLTKSAICGSDDPPAGHLWIMIDDENLSSRHYVIDASLNDRSGGRCAPASRARCSDVDPIPMPQFTN